MRCRNRALVVTAGCLLGLLLCSGVCGADPFSVSGNLNYRENGGEDMETEEAFNQSYNVNFIKQLSSAMSLSAATRYNENRLSAGNDSSSVNPSASFDLRNDWFSLNLNGSQSRLDVENSVPFINKTWGGNLYSQMEKWPSLRLSYNQSVSQDDQRVHEENTESSDLGASIEYGLGGFNLLYDFRMSDSDDLVNDTNSETLNHYAQVKYNESFFHKRLSIGATQQYSSSETETDAAVGEDGVVMQPVTLMAGFSLISTTNPLYNTLVATPALVDGDDAASAGVQLLPNDDDEYVNIGIQVDRQAVSRVQLFLDDLLTPTEQAALTSASWRLYRSDETDPDEWVQVPQLPTVSFGTLSGRTVVTVDVSTPVTARYLKVVISNIPLLSLADAVDVAEVEAGELITTDADRLVTTTKFVTHQTQLSLNYQIAPSWSAGYNMRRVLNQPDTNLDNTQVTHSVHTAYSPSTYFSLALGASENRDETEGEDETMTRSYSMAVNSAPLTTLDLSLGYTRTHGYEDGVETDQGDSVHGNLAAEIFPDLTMGFSPSWTRNQALDTGATTTTYGFTLTSSARLTPRLNLNGNWNYAHVTAETEADQEEAEATSSRQYGATLSYRPSDVLLVSTTLRRNEDTDDTSLSANMAWLMTRTIQSNAGASFGLGEDDPDQYTASLNWAISRNLSLQGGGAYQVAAADESDIWSLMTSLNAHY